MKERFDKCQVGNLRLKSGLKSFLNMILLKMKVDSVREKEIFLAFQSSLAGLKSFRKLTKQY